MAETALQKRNLPSARLFAGHTADDVDRLMLPLDVVINNRQRDWAVEHPGVAQHRGDRLRHPFRVRRHAECKAVNNCQGRSTTRKTECPAKDKEHQCLESSRDLPPAKEESSKGSLERSRQGRDPAEDQVKSLEGSRQEEPRSEGESQ